jgi:flagellar motor switch/type III secretory pathway protein FliN
LEEIKSATVWRKQSFDRLDMENKETEKAETNTEETSEATEEIIEKADSEEPGEDAVETTAALENVLVNLRVEIAGDKISLREVQKLRTGQIINLGCRPTDTVRIVTDTSDQPVALGELVDIEGQLGVRLTRIFI